LPKNNNGFYRDRTVHVEWVHWAQNYTTLTRYCEHGNETFEFFKMRVILFPSEEM